MRIFLIRHGETVDNVANLYAGVRDSALTVHGSLQVQRLAKSLIESGLRFTSVFSSDLQRAHKTASAICVAQSDQHGDDTETRVEVTTLSTLREQDFGIYEGKPFSARLEKSKSPVSEEKVAQAQRQHHDHDNSEVESKESMGRRAKAFLDEHLVPIITRTIDDDTSAVAIVSHGILLTHLWRTFLRLLPMNSITLSPGLAVGGGSGGTLEHIGGWSNTGYLEMVLQRPRSTSVESKEPNHVNHQILSSSSTSVQPTEATGPEVSLGDIRVTIATINGKDHLAGLKRTRGGVGSSKQEDGQTTIEAFFKKRKI